MILDLIFGRRTETAPAAESLQVGGRLVPLRLVRHPRARRYVLRLLPDGSARVTIPRGGSLQGARDFAGRQTGWLENQFQKLRDKPAGAAAWAVGSQIFFRGELATIESRGPGYVELGGQMIRCGETTDLRPAIQGHLRRLAASELPARVRALAAGHGVAVSQVSVRSQRTRWGSCSRHGRISLNWRLIQLPPLVSDYIILHELMHRRQLNHSPRFWREVAGVCPEYKIAERWLKEHAALLG